MEERIMKQKKPVPVYMLSGFLGSGKTTFLTKAIDYLTETGRKPAVVMNEIGEVNLDGQLIDSAVPMTEMLSGCICCSIREDLGVTIKELLDDNEPDLIFIEATGIANPIEIVDEVTDASLIYPVELKSVITVVDAPQLLQLSRTSVGKTFQLMKEQILCASLLIVNKTDLLSTSDLKEVEQLISAWNPNAALELTVFSQVNMSLWEEALEYQQQNGRNAPSSGQRQEGHTQHDHGHDHHGHDQHDDHSHHHTHDHVIAYTHYFERQVNSDEFELFLSTLPPEVFRAKGILTFSDTESRFMFQYAYGEVDFVKIRPQGEVRDVAVFIGENFAKEKIRTKLLELEKKSYQEEKHK
jgi:G3E family GTPase